LFKVLEAQKILIAASPNLRFTAQVTRKLILKGIVSKIQMDLLIEVIHEVFCEHLGTPLLELMSDNVDNNGSQKRRLETVGHEGKNKKRQLR